MLYLGNDLSYIKNIDEYLNLLNTSIEVSKMLSGLIKDSKIIIPIINIKDFIDF
jgi:hypothetical protein